MPVDFPQPIGGLYGINVETLAGDKTLTPGTDEMYQYLRPDVANRDVILDTASAQAGDRFVILNTRIYGNTWTLTIKQGAATLDIAYGGLVKSYIFDGTNWVKENNGAADATHSDAVGLGGRAYAGASSVAIGYNAVGGTKGVAIGHLADTGTTGESIAIGDSAKTNDKKRSIALGYQSECERTGETSININGTDSDQENNVVQGRWERELAGGAGATEIFCAGLVNMRFTIRPNSVLAFEMIIVARDNVANEVARYSVHDGLIKRDGADNTAIVLCTVTVDHEDDAGWDVAVTADDINEALIITVTGDAANPTQWAAVMNGVETHF